MYLRCFTYETPKEWVKLLLWAEYWYNTTYHTSLSMALFKVVYGQVLPTLVKYVPTKNDPISVQDHLLQRDEIMSKLKMNFQKA